MTDEAERWSKLDKVTISEFKDEDGIVNEFGLMYAQQDARSNQPPPFFGSLPSDPQSLASRCGRYHVRKSFPLHYQVFKQTASHLPHEGNSEQLFSRSGALSDDNGKMGCSQVSGNTGNTGLAQKAAHHLVVGELDARCTSRCGRRRLPAQTRRSDHNRRSWVQHNPALGISGK